MTITAEKFFNFYKKKSNMDLIQIASQSNIKFEFSDSGALKNSVLFMLQKPENENYYKIVDDRKVLENCLFRMQSIYKIIRDNSNIINSINLKNDRVAEFFLHINLELDQKGKYYIKIDTLFCTGVGSYNCFFLELESHRINSQRYLFFDEENSRITFKTKQRRNNFSDTLAYDGLSTCFIKDFPYPELKEFSILKEHQEELTKLSEDNVEFIYRDGSGARINTTLTMEDLHQAGLRKTTNKRDIFTRKYSQFLKFSPLISDKGIEKIPITDLYFLFKVWLILEHEEWLRFYGWYKKNKQGKFSLCEKVFEEVASSPKRITEYHWLSNYYKDKYSDEKELIYQTFRFVQYLKNLKLFYKKIPANYESLTLMLADAKKIQTVIEFRTAIKDLKKIIKKKENKTFDYTKVAIPNETRDVLEEFSQYKPITIHQSPKEILDVLKRGYTGEFDRLILEINRQYANEKCKIERKMKDVPIFLSYKKGNQNIFCLCVLQVRYSGEDSDTKTHFSIQIKCFKEDKAQREIAFKNQEKLINIKSLIQNYIVDKYNYDLYCL